MYYTADNTEGYTPEQRLLANDELEDRIDARGIDTDDPDPGEAAWIQNEAERVLLWVESRTPRVDGWHDLPCGGAVKIESGLPVRVSDGATDASDPDYRGPGDAVIIAAVENFTSCRLDSALEWSTACGEPDATAEVTVVGEG